MVKKTYQITISNPAKVARVMVKNQPVSLKYSTELIREIKGKKVSKAERFLNNILTHQEFLPLRKYVRKIGHKKGNAKSFTKIGRYPQNLAKTFLKILASLKSNADYKGLDSQNLLIVHGFASMGFSRTAFQSQGRISGKKRKRKSAHIEIVAVEAA